MPRRLRFIPLPSFQRQLKRRLRLLSTRAGSFTAKYLHLFYINLISAEQNRYIIPYRR